MDRFSDGRWDPARNQGSQGWQLISCGDFPSVWVSDPLVFFLCVDPWGREPVCNAQHPAVWSKIACYCANKKSETKEIKWFAQIIVFSGAKFRSSNTTSIAPGCRFIAFTSLVHFLAFVWNLVHGEVRALEVLGLESTVRNDRELISQGKALSAPDVRKATELGWTSKNQEHHLCSHHQDWQDTRDKSSELLALIATAQGRMV